MQLEQHRLGRLAHEPQLSGCRVVPEPLARYRGARRVEQRVERDDRVVGHDFLRRASRQDREAAEACSPCALKEREPNGGVVGDDRRGTSPERGGDGSLLPRADVERRERESGAVLASARAAGGSPSCSASACSSARARSRTSPARSASVERSRSAVRAASAASIASRSSTATSLGGCGSGWAAPRRESARAEPSPTRHGAPGARSHPEPDTERRPQPPGDPPRVGELLLGAGAIGEQPLEASLCASPREAAASRRCSISARRAPEWSRSSCAIRAWMPAMSTASFSARSAAVAWSASGRKRLRTSSSTSRARSTCSATRESFSSARCRRLLNFPSPLLPPQRNGDPPAATRAPARPCPGPRSSAWRRRAPRPRGSQPGRCGEPTRR